LLYFQQFIAKLTHENQYMGQRDSYSYIKNRVQADMREEVKRLI
jgi:hypothetical protein